MKFTQKQTSIALYTLAAGILCIPFFGMQLSDEVKWSGYDFMMAGVMLFGTAIGIDLILRTIEKPSHRILLIVTVVCALLLVWAELAVGIFGTPFSGS